MISLLYPLLEWPPSGNFQSEAHYATLAAILFVPFGKLSKGLFTLEIISISLVNHAKNKGPEEKKGGG